MADKIDCFAPEFLQVDRSVHVIPAIDRIELDYLFDLFHFRIEKEFSDKLVQSKLNHFDRSSESLDLNEHSSLFRTRTMKFISIYLFEGPEEWRAK